MTDNGSAYRSHDFRKLCAASGPRHIRTRPYTPRTNGKAERFIQTSLREWAYARAYQCSAERTDAMTSWIDAYNPALYRPSFYVIEANRLCCSGCDPAGCLGFCRAR
jgi:transposase InsO family protein